jgi:hypothetical protein
MGKSHGDVVQNGVEWDFRPEVQDIDSSMKLSDFGVR